MNSTIQEINWKKNLIFVWISQILAMAGFAAITPFIPLFLRDHYKITDEKTLGLWVSALTFFGMFSFCLSAPLWGVLADRYGRKLMLLRSYYVTAFLFPLLFFAPSILCFIAIRFLVSAFSGTVTAAQTLVVTNTPQEHHGVALGTLSTALWSGNMIGFLAGALFVNYFGYFWGFTICGILYLAGGIIVQFFVKENFVKPLPQEKAEKKGSIFSHMRGISAGIWIILILFVVMGMARRFDEPYISILVEKINGNQDAILYTGIISTVAALGGLFSGIIMGKLCDKYSPFKIAVPAILLAATTMVIQALSFNMAMLGSARFVHFTSAGGLEPAFQTLLSRMSPDAKRGTLFGLASSLRMIGILFAALLGGIVIYTFSIRAIFIGSCVLFLTLLPLLYWAAKYLNQAKNHSTT